MLQKCLKSDIYTNENYFCDSLEQAIDVDFTLPDYCPDISKIFKCHATPRITSKSISGSTVTLDGNVIITILYCDKESRFSSFEYNFPFSKNIELTSDVTGGNVFCRIKCDYINCRAVTGRKVDIHGAAGIFVRIFKRKCNEIICDIEDDGIEVKKLTAPATVPMGYAEKYLLLEEDLPLSQGQAPIESTLKINSAVCVKETKIINDKTVVKGELVVSVLYCPEGGGTPETVKSVLPYSQIVDIEGVTDTCECECKAEIASLDIKPKPTSNGEFRCFGLMAKILVTCEAYCSNEIPVIEDAFSRRFEADIQRKTVPFNKLTCNIRETYHCKKGIELEFNINSVIDLWCSVQGCHTKFEDEKMVITGTLMAGMIICDENNIPIYIEKPIEFEYTHPFKENLGSAHCDPEIEVLSCGFTITSANKIELHAELGINAGIYEKKDISIICDLNIDETKVIKRKGEGAMIIYFASDGDSVWDIANKYSAPVNEIMEINGLENGKLTNGKMVLIPLN
ncbi:MAG: DUF3794 domain-containing protein [Clostridia bacterium]|nr:DUF3794 domain-containing protein [Clostridia bacterium]